MTAAREADGRRPVVLGRIGAPFGVQGWLKVRSYTDPPEGIVSYAVWELDRSGSLGRRAVPAASRVHFARRTVFRDKRLSDTPPRASEGGHACPSSPTANPSLYEMAWITST